MAFWGKAFVFNGTPCEEFDLMLYDIGGEEQGDSDLAGTVSIVEESIARKWKPFFYGVKFNKKLSFEMVFGVNVARLDNNQYLDRYEINEIAAWLTGHDKYMWLEIEQDDMTYVRYRCMITQLSVVNYGKVSWALKATVTCDGPFAYMTPQSYEITLNGNKSYSIYNASSMNAFYKPKLIYEPDNGGNLTISNDLDPGHVFQLTDIPAEVTEVTVDNENCVITNDAGIDLYSYFNFKFLRLGRGYNTLTLTGHGKLTIICEYPVNIGG